MFSRITSKFQITIPREIRLKLKLSRNDSIEWIEDNGRIYVKSTGNDFTKFKGLIMTGEGNIEHDISTAKVLVSGKISE